MKTTTVLVPFEDLMNAIEDMLYDKKLIREDEFLVYADLGLQVNENNVVSIEVDLDVVDHIDDLFKDRDGYAVEEVDGGS